MRAEANKKLIEEPIDMGDSENQMDILLQKAASDPGAFAKLYRLHYDQVFRYCCRRLFNRHSAEDVTSTVFFKVIGTIGSFKGDSKDFRNWLYRIATNAANDHLRTAVKRAQAIRIVADNARSDRHVIANDDLGDKKSLLKQALLGLKPKYQAVIALHFFENMKLTQVAKVLDQTPTTTRSQLSRALKKLRKQLRASGSDV